MGKLSREVIVVKVSSRILIELETLSAGEATQFWGLSLLEDFIEVGTE